MINEKELKSFPQRSLETGREDCYFISPRSVIGLQSDITGLSLVSDGD